MSLNGIKIFGDFPVDKVVSDTATLIRDAGCGLDKLFHDLLRAQGCVYRRASDFCVYEGGLSAVIRDQQVLVGSASFMHLMEITLPQGLNVKTRCSAPSTGSWRAYSPSTTRSTGRWSRR